MSLPITAPAVLRSYLARRPRPIRMTPGARFGFHCPPSNSNSNSNFEADGLPSSSSSSSSMQERLIPHVLHLLSPRGDQVGEQGDGFLEAVVGFLGGGTGGDHVDRQALVER